MAAIHGKNTYVELDNALGVPVPLSVYFKETATSRSMDTAESSTYGTTAKTYVMGMNDETVTISGNFDSALHTHMTALIAALDDSTLASCTVTVGPAGNAVGKPKSSRECFITAYNWSASTSDVVSVSISFQRSGATTESVF